jgi:carbon storage regulator
MLNGFTKECHQMLVLSRLQGETIVIGENIRVTIKSVGNGRCQIAVDAPKDVRIMRQEVEERDARNKA